MPDPAARTPSPVPPPARPRPPRPSVNPFREPDIPPAPVDDDEA